jgi:hypothetical protein
MKGKEVRQHRLTVEELKTMKGYQNITPEQADNLLNFLEEFCRLMYQCYLKEGRKK